jgi:hypothetical protein
MSNTKRMSCEVSHKLPADKITKARKIIDYAYYNADLHQFFDTIIFARLNLLSMVIGNNR